MNREQKFFLASLLVHLVAAFCSQGFHQFDEHYQVLEFLNFKLGGTPESVLPWEYTEKMRSWALPAVFYGPFLFFQKIGLSSPFFLSFLARLTSAVLGWGSLIVLYKMIRPKFGEKALPFLTLIWFFPYLHVRPAGENWGLIFFVFAWASFGAKRFSLSGFLFALSFLFRFQMALAVLPFGLWQLIFGERSVKAWAQVFLTGFFALGLGVLIDYWGYGEWTLSFWNYFKLNLLEDRVSGFGVQPWWWYLRLLFNRGIPPLSLLLMLAVIYSWVTKPKSLFSWITFFFFLGHTAIGHKELRFLFPLVLLSPLALLSFPTQIWWDKKVLRRFLIGLNLILLLMVSFRPAHSAISFYRYLYTHEVKRVIVWGEDPLSFVGLPVHFYLPQRPRTFKLTEPWRLENVLQQGGRYVFVDKYEKYQKLSGCEIKYSSYPKWLLGFSPAGLLDKTWQRSRTWLLLFCQGT